jgi:hypothetical protein
MLNIMFGAYAALRYGSPAAKYLDAKCNKNILSTRVRHRTKTFRDNKNFTCEVFSENSFIDFLSSENESFRECEHFVATQHFTACVDILQLLVFLENEPSKRRPSL